MCLNGHAGFPGPGCGEAGEDRDEVAGESQRHFSSYWKRPTHDPGGSVRVLPKDHPRSTVV